MRSIFLADAHLRHPQDTNYQSLLDFLNQQKDLDALFLLGDIFEFWLGYKHVVFSAYLPLLNKLAQLSNKGTKLFFVEGNHDFNLGPYFTDTLKCKVIPEQQQLDWDGKKITISHGDLLNPDQNYHRLRSFWRSWPIKILAQIIHPDLAWSFAMWLCNKSAKNKPENCHHDPTLLLTPYAASSNSDIVICGHFHYPVDTNEDGTRIIALGDWIDQYSYAEMIDGKIELKNWEKCGETV
ncbi:MAG: UDP-2,3-diacylglucosamine diphosphatase [Desulfuromonadales bacterium]|nr:UDP-2,3-diacylglucosamine diphosphatase [Desulfuromonadales bacterium]